MRTYISGRISGLDFDDVIKNFKSAYDLLQSVGLQPVNPLDNGLSRNETWEKHMIRDIEILLSCDAILMLDDWIDSRGARIEKVIAQEAGLRVLYQSNLSLFSSEFDDIKDAIFKVTGYRYEDYIKKGRCQNQLFARMVFVKYCKDVKGMSFPRIAEFVRRDHSTIMHYCKIYPSELKYNAAFRSIVQNVSKLLNQSVSV